MAAEPLGVWGTERKSAAPLRAAPAATHPQFDALYREHFDRLRRFVLGMTGREAVAEDIAQETLLRAYIRMEQLDAARPLWPWLKQVATRLVYDLRRTDHEVCVATSPAEVDVTTDVADDVAEGDLVSRAMRRLPARQRVAVTLRYLEDWKSGELAELFHLPRPAVEQLLLRARRSLSSEYRRLGGDRLRVALWPLLALLGRLRDRAVRAAANAGQAGGTSLASAVDVSTQVMVAVVVGTSLLAPAVAWAAPGGDRPAVQARPAIVAVERDDAPRENRVDEARAANLPTLPSVAVAAPQPRTRKSVTATPAATAAPAATTGQKVAVETNSAALAEAPATPKAKASGGREGAGKVATRGEVSVDVTVVDHVQVTADINAPVECGNGTVKAVGCGAVDTAAATLTGTP